jgi:hypothetical protein
LPGKGGSPERGRRRRLGRGLVEPAEERADRVVEPCRLLGEAEVAGVGQLDQLGAGNAVGDGAAGRQGQTQS